MRFAIQYKHLGSREAKARPAVGRTATSLPWSALEGVPSGQEQQVIAT